jgi:hypothetical protein
MANRGRSRRPQRAPAMPSAKSMYYIVQTKEGERGREFAKCWGDGQYKHSRVPSESIPQNLVIACLSKHHTLPCFDIEIFLNLLVSYGTFSKAHTGLTSPKNVTTTVLSANFRPANAASAF